MHLLSYFHSTHEIIILQWYMGHLSYPFTPNCDDTYMDDNV